MVKVYPADFETKISFKILKVILYALLAKPLLIWSGFLFPFITTKILYFRILIEISLFFYIPLAAKYRELRPRKSFLVYAVWIYLAVLAITSILGVDSYRSFWGTVERGEGIISMLHFALYFTILPAVFASRESWRKYLHAALGMIVLCGFYGLAQLVNLSGVIQPGGGDRISGTIGNASFFAALMLFGIFLAVYIYQNSRSAVERWYLGSMIILEIILLYLSETRGAIIAFVLAGVIFLVCAWLFSAQKKTKLTAAIILLGTLMSIAGLYASRSSQFVRAHPTLARLTSISASDITTQSRFDTWRASYQAWQERVWIGYGYENYNIAFNKHFPSRIFKDAGSQIWFDRAHNLFFDIATTSGIAGLLAYASLIAAACHALWKISHQKNSNWQIPTTLGLLLFAYLIQNLFVFDTQATYLMVFLVFGFLVFLETETRPIPEQPGFNFGRAWQVPLAGIVVAILVIVNWQPAVANHTAILGITAAKSGHYSDFLSYFQKGLSSGTYMDEEIRQKLADYATEILPGLSSASQTELYGYVRDQLEKNLAADQHDAKNYLYLMNILSLTSNPSDLDRVFALGQEALRFSPTRAHIYFVMGQAAFARQDKEAGLDYFRKALALNPHTKEAHLNYLMGGIIAREPGIVSSEQAILEKDYEPSVNDYVSLAGAYLRSQDRAGAIASYQQALVKAPHDPKLLGSLATVYAEICDLDKVREQISRAVTQDQSLRDQAVMFMAEVEKKCKK